MNTEEFNKLSNFAKLVELCAVPCYAPRYVYLVFPNGKKHRLYVDSYAARKYNVNASIVDKTIDFDIVYHKAGDTYKTPWGETLKFKNDCTQVIINGYK